MLRPDTPSGFLDSIQKILQACYPPPVAKLLYEEIFVQRVYGFKTEVNAPVILDCGANIGISTLFLKHEHPEAVIHAFEPDSSAFQMLTDNVGRFNLTDISLHNFAIARTDGIREFFTSPANIPVMSLYPNELATLKLEVPTLSFGAFVSRLDRVNFCKMDIEGAESEAILSLVDWNCLDRIDRFAIEYHRWVDQLLTLQEFKAIFTEWGYEVSDKVPDTPFSNHRMSDNNYLTVFRKGRP